MRLTLVVDGSTTFSLVVFTKPSDDAWISYCVAPDATGHDSCMTAPTGPGDEVNVNGKVHPAKDGTAAKMNKAVAVRTRIDLINLSPSRLLDEAVALRISGWKLRNALG